LMKDVELKNPERIYRRILFYVKRLYRKAKLVHGDLSEYNIMLWKRNIIVFDVSQAVSIEHPNSNQFLVRDIENLNRYFKKLGVDVMPVEETFRRVTGGAIIC
ncbi:MAG: RIO1 family regulatory kinase/ATPase, partial [Candidatus Bathyarchaeia archaeon]